MVCCHFICLKNIAVSRPCQWYLSGILSEYERPDLVLIEVSPKLSKEQRLVVQNNALNVMRNNKITKNFKFAIVSKVAECGCASVMM